MKIYKLVYSVYSLARAVARATGINRIIRRSVGPLVARFVFNTARNSEIPLQIQGHKMFLAPAGRYPSPDMVADRYERATTQLFKQLIAPGMTVVDVGANVGYFSLLAADLVGPTGTVYAFEPEPKNHILLMTNIEMNSYTNIRTAQVAVSNTCGHTQLFVSVLDNGSHSIHHEAARGVAAEVSVDTVTLDAFLESEGWPTVDLLKIDVEGAELLVLEGMEKFVRDSDGLRLIIEYCPSLIHAAGTPPQQLIEKLTSMNFQIQFVDEKKGPLPPEETDAETITTRLMKQEGYMNLVCTQV